MKNHIKYISKYTNVIWNARLILKYNNHSWLDSIFV